MASSLDSPGKKPSRRADLESPSEPPDPNEVAAASSCRRKTVKALLPHLVSSLFIGDDCTPDVGQFDGLPNSPNASPRCRPQQQQQQYQPDAARSATVSASSSCHRVVTSLKPPWQLDFDDSNDEMSNEIAADDDVTRDEPDCSGADTTELSMCPSGSPPTSTQTSPRCPSYLISNVFDFRPVNLTTGKKCDYAKRDNAVLGCDADDVNSSKRQPSGLVHEHPPPTAAAAGSPRPARSVRHTPCRKPVVHRADSTYEVFHHVNADESSLSAASTTSLKSCPAQGLASRGLDSSGTATQSMPIVSPRGLNPGSPRTRGSSRFLLRREDTLSGLLSLTGSTSSTSTTVSSPRTGRHANSVDTKLNVLGGNMHDDERQRQWLAEQNRELTVHSPSITGELLGRPRLRRRAAWDSDSKDSVFGAGRHDNETPSTTSTGSVRTRRPDNVAYMFGGESHSPGNQKSKQSRQMNSYASTPADGIQAAGLLTRPGLQRENTFHNLFGQQDPVPCCASPVLDRFTSKTPKLVKDTVSEHLNATLAHSERRVPGRRSLVEWDRTNTITGQSLPYNQPLEKVESRIAWIDGHFQELVARQSTSSFTQLRSATSLVSDSVTEVHDGEFGEKYQNIRL